MTSLDGEDGDDATLPGPGHPDIVDGGAGHRRRGLCRPPGEAVTVDLGLGLRRGGRRRSPTTLTGIANVLGARLPMTPSPATTAAMCSTAVTATTSSPAAAASTISAAATATTSSTAAAPPTRSSTAKATTRCGAATGDDDLLADAGDETARRRGRRRPVAGGSGSTHRELRYGHGGRRRLAPAPGRHPEHGRCGPGRALVHREPDRRRPCRLAVRGRLRQHARGSGGTDRRSIGDDGDDILRGGTGDRPLSGGDGIDRASYGYATGGVTVEPGHGHGLRRTGQRHAVRTSRSSAAVPMPTRSPAMTA